MSQPIDPAVLFQRLDILGQVVGSLSHDVNTPLGYVKSNYTTLNRYIDAFKQLIIQYDQLLILKGEGDRETYKALLETIQSLKTNKPFQSGWNDIDALLSESLEGLNRIQAVIERLSTFTYPDTGMFKPVDMNQCLEFVFSLLEDELSSRYTIYRHWGEVPPVKGLPNQLSHVFMTLFIQAIQAHPFPGKHSIHMNDIFVETRVEEAHVFVSIAVSIRSTDTEERFDSFSGLPLAEVTDMIQNHQGILDIQSHDDQSMTFTIQLPLYVSQ